MKINKLTIFTLFGALFLNSCSSDDDVVDPIEPQPEESYTNGFFVLNEGSQSAGTVTYISQDFQTTEQEIFQNVNEGNDLGKFVQSIFFEEDLAYIISNGSNLITVVDRYTFELVGLVDSGLQVPRYGVVANGKAYVTNQGNFEDGEATEFDDYVAVIDLETLEVEETIQLNAPAEYIIEENNLFYIQNATYGTGNTISELDPTTNTITNTFHTNEGLSDFDVENEFLYALSKTELWKIDINTGEEVIKLVFPEGNNAGRIDIEDDIIYYTIGSAVYRLGLDDTEAAEDPVLNYNSASSYAVYGFEVEGDYIYTAEAPSFSENGNIRVYSLSGDLTAEFDSGGIGPNGFYFND